MFSGQDGKDWIFQHWGQAGPIADELRAFVERAVDWNKKLNTLYLVNDVLHHALAQRHLSCLHIILLSLRKTDVDSL